MEKKLFDTPDYRVYAMDAEDIVRTSDWGTGTPEDEVSETGTIIDIPEL